jgi:WD40 repeat protein
LPPESQLPPVVAAEAARTAPDGPQEETPQEADPAQLADSPDRTPWLRLDFAGHVGTIRSLVFTPDTERLCTAGDDKAVIVWRRPRADAAGVPRWTYERTIRWQIQRGPRGRIYALAAGPDRLALAGNGATGQIGEIVLVDPATGQQKLALTDERIGHRQVVVSLAFSPTSNAPGLVSTDMEGRTLYWSPTAETGLWGARQLQAPDRETYGTAGQALLALRRFAPVAMPNAQTAMLPAYAGKDRHGEVQWRLQAIDVTSGRSRALSGGDVDGLHTRMVMALAASADGRRLASSDDAGRVFVWDLRRGRGPVQLPQQPAPVISLAFNRDGSRLLTGGYRGRSQPAAELQLWDVADLRRPQRLRSTRAADHVLACAMTGDGQSVAYAQGPAAVAGPAADLARATTLRAPIRPPLRVAFARHDPPYRVAFGFGLTGDGGLVWEQSFDLATVQLGRDKALAEADWQADPVAQGDWSVAVETGSAGDGPWLVQAGQRRARLPLLPNRHGAPSATGWIPDRQGRPLAVAVGTNVDNNIYVFRLTVAGACPLLRVFRGHEGAVTSLSVSRDGRYLASAGLDATIRVWPLRDVGADDELVNRWGATFAVVDNQLQVATIREDGPLFFRGLRAGDVIRRLSWRDGTELAASDVPTAMREGLRQRPWDQLLAFESERGRTAVAAFQLLPAWQPLATLIVAENREWAYWAPSGYYDASFEGHKLFGWQVNRGLQRAPDFFRAAQLRQRLERPDIMSRLLAAGSVEAAFRAVHREPPLNSQLAVRQEYLLKPQVTILKPTPGTLLTGDRATIEAEITVGPGQELVPPKAFANGVLGAGGQLVAQAAADGGQKFTYRWDARLPSDPRLLIQVVAATGAKVADWATVVVDRTPPVRRPARLFVAVAGVNQYRDAQLPKLDFAVRNAGELAAALRDGAGSLYRSRAASLLDQRVTRPAWIVTMEHYAAELRVHASPDDLLVIFLSGHGVRDSETGLYYFVTAEARYGDLLAGRYADCLAFEDLSLFADVPCRKLVILDTCHSGAIQPLRQQQLKAALRALQDDLVFTLTASEGDQEAAETRQRRLGRFTARLIEALQGQADQQAGNRDGVVTLDEAAEYAQRMVAADSAADPVRQHPTAGPRELLDFARVPLTQSAAPGRAPPR